MAEKSTTVALFALRVLMDKYKCQKELYCVCVDPEKAYDNVPREEVWYCTRKSGLAEKYVRIVQRCVCSGELTIGPTGHVPGAPVQRGPRAETYSILDIVILGGPNSYCSY